MVLPAVGRLYMTATVGHVGCSPLGEIGTPSSGKRLIFIPRMTFLRRNLAAPYFAKIVPFGAMKMCIRIASSS